MEIHLALKAIIEKDGKILIIKRSEKEDYFKGIWDLPGGKISFGEEPYESLKREVKEVIRNCWFDTAAIPFLYDNSVYIRLKEIIGIEKIVFGTDFPLLKPNRYYKEFENANLTLNHRRKILGENIKNILNI